MTWNDIDRIALGYLRIDPKDWPRWTLREFNLALEGWMEVNVHQPWEIGRVVAYYVLNSQGAKLSRWEDVFPLAIDEKRGRKVKREKAILRESTKEEQADFLRLTNG